MKLGDKSGNYYRKTYRGKNKLTLKQEAVYKFIKGFINKKGYPPSIREIALHFNISTVAAMCHSIAIEKKGFIKRIQNISRGIVILK